jgi:UDP-N-acetylmuramyl tripeptide synthase
VLAQVDLRGRVKADIAVIEMDEAHGAKVSRQLAPRVVVLTNVMTDQIDRFSEPGRVADMLRTVASCATQVVVTNADDALLQERTAELKDVKVVRYGVAPQVLTEAPHGLGNVKTSETRLTEGTLVSFCRGSRATVEHWGSSADIELPARGVHFALDAAAAIAAASAILGEQFDLGRARSVIGTVPPVFGRGEVVKVRGKLVEFVLVQNPASFQLNVDELEPHLEQVLVAMGSDVRDPSYLWPVDTHPLEHVSVVSGSLAEEVALQLLYHDVRVDLVDHDLGHAVDKFLELPDPGRGVKTIIFSADSMRRIRTHLGLA